MVRKALSFIFISLIFQSVTTFATGPAYRITVEDIYRDHTFTPQGISELRSMLDGEHYTVRTTTRIEQFSYRTGELTRVLFDADRFGEIDRITGYAFNPEETQLMIETGRQSIYRHSYLARFFVYDLASETLYPVSRNGMQQLATFSPGGDQVAFVRNNNLYIADPLRERELQVTFDGKQNEIINGAPDWVYEEEFAFAQGFHWSPDGKKIAFYRCDERNVKSYPLTYFGSLYPRVYTFKYPKAGEQNSLVSILVYDTETGSIREMDTGEETDQYIPRIQWTRDPEVLSIIRLNRLQNHLEILHSDTRTGSSAVVYEESNPRYISEPSDQTVTYIDDEHLILLSEKSGYFHFYLYNFKTGAMEPVTSGDFDVIDLLDYDPSGNRIYYTSYEVSSIEKHVYSIKLNGSGKKKISTEPGSNRANFSNSFDYYILFHSSANRPQEISLYDRRGHQIRVLEDNRRLQVQMEQYGFSQTEFLTVHTAGGQDLNAFMIKPADFDPAKKYPLFMYVYGGPESQNVVDEWGRRTAWFQLLAQHGYIVACVDNRGTNGRGEAFRKATYLTLGHLETIDQVESAGYFGSLDFIDADRIGIFGWSYGGFMTSLCMTRGEGIFKLGIAVAPVTNWRYYDTIYTERFMRTPSENPDGYDLNSPIHYADLLQGQFLLIHGSGDDNVHFQNTMDFTEALVQANKQFEMQIYPNRNHSIRGGNTTLHLYTRMTDFILQNL